MRFGTVGQALSGLSTLLTRCSYTSYTIAAHRAVATRAARNDVPHCMPHKTHDHFRAYTRATGTPHFLMLQHDKVRADPKIESKLSFDSSLSLSLIENMLKTQILDTD